MRSAASISACTVRRACTGVAAEQPAPPDALASLSEEVFGCAERAPRLTFLLGGPGSGKGTLATQLEQRRGWCHVSSGELLRREAARGSALGLHVGALINEGSVVGSDVVTKLLLQFLRDKYVREGGVSVCVDGFPRSYINAIHWQDVGRAPVRVLSLDVPENVMMKRLRGRGRDDDDCGVVAKRIALHNKEWPKIRDLYDSAGLLTTLDGTGTAEAVWCRFVQAESSF